MTTKSISLLESDLMDFERVLLTAVSAAFAADDALSDQDIRQIWRIEEEADSMGNGRMSLQTESWRDARTIMELRKTLEALPETSGLTTFISDRFSKSGIKVVGGNREFPVQEGLGLLVYFCWTRHKRIRIPVTKLVSTFIQELRVLSQQQSVQGRFEYFAGVAALDLPSAVDEVQLTPKIKIRRLSKPEREENAYNLNIGLPQSDTFGPLKCRVALIYEFEQELVLTRGDTPTKSVLPFNDLNGPLEATLKTLHLLFDGNPTVLFAEQRSVDSVIDFNSGRFSPNSTGLFQRPMLIDTNLVDRLKKTLATVFANRNSQIKLALSRLAQSTSRTDPTDRLIDAVIALETLLTPADTSTDMTFRIATYFAMIGEKSEFKQRYDQMKDVFKTRGKIVHGGTDQHAKLAEQSNLATAFAKEAILWCLEHPKLPNLPKIEDTFWQDYLFEHFQPPTAPPP